MHQRVRSKLLKRVKTLHEYATKELDSIFEECQELLLQHKRLKKRNHSSPEQSSSSEEEDLHLFDSDEDDQDEEEEDSSSSVSNDERVIDLGGEDNLVDPMDERVFERLVQSIRLDGFQKALDRSPWFDRRYGFSLNMVRNGMGYNAVLAHQIFDGIRNQHAKVSVERLDRTVHDTCCMCNSTRDCTHKLMEDDETYYVANKCVQLAKALIAFFEALRGMVDEERGCDLFVMDECLAEVMRAHANKAGNK